jgi:hypothetical protein
LMFCWCCAMTSMRIGTGDSFLHVVARHVRLVMFLHQNRQSAHSQRHSAATIQQQQQQQHLDVAAFAHVRPRIFSAIIFTAFPFQTQHLMQVLRHGPSRASSSVNTSCRSFIEHLLSAAAASSGQERGSHHYKNARKRHTPQPGARKAVFQVIRRGPRRLRRHFVARRQAQICKAR